ncbi:MAG TPA: CHRD domain-containing protein [Fodinibius sp.]|nr:CHRD domain-containing protein [Fodinibius sp.]
MEEQVRFILTIPLFVALCLGLPQWANAQQSRDVILGGYNYEPAVRTSGSGMVTVTLREDSLYVKGDFSNLTSSYRGAYIMVGKKGQTGNMLFRLNALPNEEKTGGVFNTEKNTFALNDAQKQLLENGQFYIAITSWDHPHGELRGQIPPMKAKSARQRPEVIPAIPPPELPARN